MLVECETFKNLCPIRNGLVSGAGAVSVTYAAAATAATRRRKWEGNAALRGTGARKHRVLEMAWPQTLNYLGEIHY